MCCLVYGCIQSRVIQKLGGGVLALFILYNQLHDTYPSIEHSTLSVQLCIMYSTEQLRSSVVRRTLEKTKQFLSGSLQTTCSGVTFWLELHYIIKIVVCKPRVEGCLLQGVMWQSCDSLEHELYPLNHKRDFPESDTMHVYGPSYILHSG